MNQSFSCTFSPSWNAFPPTYYKVIKLQEEASSSGKSKGETDKVIVDAAAHLLWKRSEKYASKGVPDDWDGCEILTKKTW